MQTPPAATKSVSLSNMLSDLKTLNQRLRGVSNTTDSVSQQLNGSWPKAKAGGTDLVSPGNLLNAINEQIQESFSYVNEIENRLSDVCDALGNAYHPDSEVPPVDFVLPG